MRTLTTPRPLTREPKQLRELGPLPRPWRAKLAALIALLLLLLLLPALWDLLHGPESLDDVRLVGARGPEPLNVVLALDESGSFTDYAQVRAEVLSQFINWGRENLRADDTLTVVSFAGTAGTRLPTTPIDDLTPNPTYRAVELGDDTNFQPAITEAINTTTAASVPLNGPVALVVLTDTITSDISSQSSDEVNDLIDDLDAMSMTVIVPDGVDIESGWHDTFAWSLELEASVDSPNKTALAVGEAMAHATGQRLEER